MERVQITLSSLEAIALRDALAKAVVWKRMEQHGCSRLISKKVQRDLHDGIKRAKRRAAQNYRGLSEPMKKALKLIASNDGLLVVRVGTMDGKQFKTFGSLINRGLVAKDEDRSNIYLTLTQDGVTAANVSKL